MLDFVKQALYSVINLLSPEDKRVERFLRMDPQSLSRHLPKPRSIEADDIYALFDYRDNNVRALIKAIKYKGNVNVVKRMSLYLYEEIVEFVSDAMLWNGGEKIIIVPIPISSKRKAERGWSQCELLCKEIERLSEGAFDLRFNLLKKVKETKRQTDLKRTERLNNVRNSMEAKLIENSKLKIENCLVIVVDDVYTTGATFLEAKRALRNAGAKKVVGFFLAH